MRCRDHVRRIFRISRLRKSIANGLQWSLIGAGDGGSEYSQSEQFGLNFSDLRKKRFIYVLLIGHLKFSGLNRKLTHLASRDLRLWRIIDDCLIYVYVWSGTHYHIGCNESRRTDA